MMEYQKIKKFVRQYAKLTNYIYGEKLGWNKWGFRWNVQHLHSNQI